LLNDIFDFESKLTVDEVEDEIREEQNASFIEGKAIHTFEELTAILDYVPAGWESDDDEESGSSDEEDIDDEALPDIDEEDESALKGDSSLKWDEDEEEDEDSEGDSDSEDEDEESEDEDEDEADDEEAEEDERPRRGKRR